MIIEFLVNLYLKIANPWIIRGIIENPTQMTLTIEFPNHSGYTGKCKITTLYILVK